MPVPTQPVPTECEEMAYEIEQLEQQREDLGIDLDTAHSQQKSGISRQIRNLGFLIRAKRPALNACIATFGGPPTVPPLESSFTGIMSMTTDRKLKGEAFTDKTNWGLLFDGPRTQMFVTAFPEWVLDTTDMANEIAQDLKIFFKKNLTTISRSKTDGGIGIFSAPTGTLALPLQLRFDHSRDLPFYDEDSDLSIVLSTAGPRGSPVTANGNVRLAGSGTFVGGWLGGIICTIVITGTLAPAP